MPIVFLSQVCENGKFACFARGKVWPHDVRSHGSLRPLRQDLFLIWFVSVMDGPLPPVNSPLAGLPNVPGDMQLPEGVW